MGAIEGQVNFAERTKVFGEAQFSDIVFVILKRILTDFIIDKKNIENTFPLTMVS